MEFLSTASMIGGIIAFVLFVVIIPYCLSGESEGDQAAPIAIAWLIVGLLALAIGFDASRVHLVTWLISIPAYFAVGFLWFILKWRGLILRKLAVAKIEADEFDPIKYPTTTDSREKILERARPDASRYKETIAGWIVLWPWSMLWTVVKWPWRLAVKIAEWARGLADQMVNSMWKF